MQTEDTHTGSDIPIRYYVMLTFLLIAGIALRLWGWSSQLFLDDEWHAFNFAMERSFTEVVFQHGMGANSIPVNIYFWLTLHTVGWSEVILRLPSMVAGIMALVILPLLVKRLWGSPVSLIFAALLAISPIVIFYTRVVRPFSPAMFFGTASLLLTLLWIREGRRRDLLISVILGFLAIFYHLYSAIAVVMPLLVAAIAACKPFSRRFGITVHAQRPWPDLCLAAAVFSTLVGIFVVTPNILNPWWLGVQGIDKSNWGTLLTFAEFIAGTARFGLPLIMFILVPLGCGLMFVRSRTLGVAFISPILVFFAVMATTTQDGAHAGIQAARYGIVFFPISFIAIAIAVEWGATKLSRSIGITKAAWFVPAVIITLWLPFLVTSPLWSIYRSSNNFTSHSGYQYHYTPISWERSPERDLVPGISIGYNEMPSLYRMPDVLKSYKGIVEYPVAIGDHFNPLFYYQHFHKLPVVAGYTRRDQSERNPPRAEWTYGNRMIDYVMTGLPPHLVNNASSWNTMVDLENIELLRKRYSGWLIVLHRNPLREIDEHIPEFGPIPPRTSPDLPTTGFVTDYISRNFGAPKMLNNHIAVWVVQ